MQGLYDPDRVRSPLARATGGQTAAATTWGEALEAIAKRIASARRTVVISDLQTGALAEVMAAFARAARADTGAAGKPTGTERPGQRAATGRERSEAETNLVFYEPLACDAVGRANEILFGRAVLPDHRMDSCDLVVSFAADFLETWISPVQYARQFAEAHGYRFDGTESYGSGTVGRLVYIGPRMSMTAANADQFLAVAPGQGPVVALAMAQAVARRARTDQAKQVQAALREMGYRELPLPDGITGRQIEEFAEAFVSAKASVALAGPAGASGPVAILTAIGAALMNFAAGRFGQTVDLAHPHALSGATAGEQVGQALDGLGPDDVLIVHNANPAYAISGAADKIRKAGAVVYLGTLADETAELAHWVLPIDSPLESWGDYDPLPGVHGLMQPTMARLFDTRPAGDILIELSRAVGRPLASQGEQPAQDFKQWLQQRWRELGEAAGSRENFDEFWTQCLRRGGLWDPGPSTSSGQAPSTSSGQAPSTSSGQAPSTSSGQAAPASAASTPAALRGNLTEVKLDDMLQAVSAPGADEVRLFVWPSIALFDGRLANRGWLQEMPEPVSYICWGSWLDVHPDLAGRLGLSVNNVVTIRSAHGQVQNVTVRLNELQSPSCVCLEIGQGHTAMGGNAKDAGVNAWSLLGPDVSREMFVVVKLDKTGRSDGPAYLSGTQDQYRRDILQWEEARQPSRKEVGRGRQAHPAAAGGLQPANGYLGRPPVREIPLGDGD